MLGQILVRCICFFVSIYCNYFMWLRVLRHPPTAKASIKALLLQPLQWLYQPFNAQCILHYMWDLREFFLTGHLLISFCLPLMEMNVFTLQGPTHITHLLADLCNEISSDALIHSQNGRKLRASSVTLTSTFWPRYPLWKKASLKITYATIN